MEIFSVEGGYSLRGEVKVSGAKNVALKVLIASLLTDEDVVIDNIPLISDVFSLIEVLRDLGVKITIEEDRHRIRVNALQIKMTSITSLKFSKLRASFLLLIPLLVRFGEVELPFSGGDKIGVRPINRTLEGLQKMGAEVTYLEKTYLVKSKKLTGTTYRFEKNTHTGTEALVMAAVLAQGQTVLENASQEPEVDELIRLLVSMGAQIKRRGRTVVITGVKVLSGGKIEIMSDRNEIVTFAAATLFTSGNVTIENVEHVHLEHFYKNLQLTGAQITKKTTSLHVNAENNFLKATRVKTSPHPGFMTDWQAPWAVLMTKAQGVSVVHETVFEKRFDYIEELIKMGAKIELFNPLVKDPYKVYNFDQVHYLGFHAIKIFGPQKLLGTELVIPDLRAGATLVLAALGAEGQSILLGIEHIDRGYEKFEQRLSQLGAKIKRERINDQLKSF